MALAQFDAETSFHARATRGNAGPGLSLLDKLDRALTKRGPSTKNRKPKA
jgi:hypothetical protein